MESLSEFVLADRDKDQENSVNFVLMCQLLNIITYSTYQVFRWKKFKHKKCYVHIVQRPLVTVLGWLLVFE